MLVSVVLLTSVLGLLIVAIRLSDVIVKTSAAGITTSMIVAFVASWAASFRWSSQLGCPGVYSQQFGYRAPDWERLPGPVIDEQSWWPLGRRCSGLDVQTGQFASFEPGWTLSVVVYTAAGFAVLCTVVLLAHLAQTVRRASQ